MRCRASKSQEQTSTRALVCRLGLIIYLGLVAFLCFGRFDSLPEVHRTFLGIPADKIAHFGMFFPFPIIGFFALDKQVKGLPQAIISFILLCAYGCIIAGVTELIQSLLPYRSEDLSDFAVDCISICCSSIIVLIFNLFPPKSRKSPRR